MGMFARTSLLFLGFCAVVICEDEFASYKDALDAPIKAEENQFNAKYDQELLSGSHAFSDLPPEVMKTRLGALVDKIDENRDGFIDKHELVNWILKSFEKLDREDAKERVAEYDLDKDGGVTFGEYLRKAYDLEEKDIIHLPKDKPGVKSPSTLIQEDKSRFNVADRNKDGKLTVEEFMGFHHPHNYPHMLPYEISRLLREVDKDNDGKVNLKEFMGTQTLDKDVQAEENEHFSKFDKNHDGFLDTDEMAAWIMPGLSAAAELEADHLIRVSDTNGDGRLTKEEIINIPDMWVGSQATNYGRHLQDEL